MESTTTQANAAITESISLKLQATIMKFKTKGNQGKKGLDILLNKNQREKKEINLERQVCYCVSIYSIIFTSFYSFLCYSNKNIQLGFIIIQSFTILSQLHLVYNQMASKTCPVFRLIPAGNYQNRKKKVRRQGRKLG